MAASDSAQGALEGSGRPKPTGNGTTAVYRLAYDEAVRALQVLDQMRDRLRVRFMVVLSAATSVTTLMVASLIRPTPPDSSTFLILAIAGSLCFLLMAGIAISAIWPSETHSGVSAEGIVRKWAEPDVGGASENVALATLAIDLSEDADQLQSVVEGLAKRFVVFLTLALAQTVFWAFLVFTYE